MSLAERLMEMQMTKKLMMLLALTLLTALPLAATETAPEGTEPTMAEPAPATESAPVTEPAENADGECSDPAIEIESDLFNPDGTLVCTFCNLSGFANCESTDGTACSAAGVNKRCYRNPPCSCEWGICSCNGTTWACYY